MSIPNRDNMVLWAYLYLNKSQYCKDRAFKFWLSGFEGKLSLLLSSAKKPGTWNYLLSKNLCCDVNKPSKDLTGTWHKLLPTDYKYGTSKLLWNALICCYGPLSLSETVRWYLNSLKSNDWFPCGSGCSTAEEWTPHELVVVGSNPTTWRTSSALWRLAG